MTRSWDLHNVLFPLFQDQGFKKALVLIKPCVMSGAWKAPPGACWLFLALPGGTQPVQVNTKETVISCLKSVDCVCLG
jgi:hypothetical protein